MGSAIRDIDFSLIGNTVGSAITATTGVGNLLNVDPLLEPLADNGGRTLTHDLHFLSPARNAGDPNFDPTDFNPPLEYDQRGPGVSHDRVWYGRTDMGSIEASFVNVIVDTLADEFDGLAPGGVSLREAIDYALVNGFSFVNFAPQLDGGTINLTLGEMQITQPEYYELYINASNLPDGLTIDAHQNSRIFNASASSTAPSRLSITNIKLTGGRTTANNAEGGAIRASDRVSVTITDCTIIGNSTTGQNARGGAIVAESVGISNSTIVGNSTSGDYANGGAIFAESLGMTGSTVSGNSTLGYDAGGGGIFASSVGNLSDCIISGNSTLGELSRGGGIYAAVVIRNVDATHAPILRVTITGNSTAGDSAKGGGIYVREDYSDTGTVDFEDSIISGNSTSGQYADGGGIYGSRDGVALINSSLTENMALGHDARGGGIFAGNGLSRGGSVAFTGSHVRGNIAAFYGGGIYSELPVTITGSDLSDNVALQRGGAIYSRTNVSIAGSTVTTNRANLGPALGGAVYSGDDVMIVDSTVMGNIAFGSLGADGGAIYSADSMTITDSTLSDNSATATLYVGRGGAVFSGGPMTLEGVTLQDNDASGRGGAIFSTGDLTMTGSTVSGNTALQYGGGIYAFNYAILTNSTVANNTAPHGGGIWATLTSLSQSTVSGNQATTGNGGGIYSYLSATIDRSTISGNSAGGDGGGLFTGAATITSSTISGNSANSSGGGAHVAAATLTHSTVTANSAGTSGGGLFADDGGTLSGSIVAANSASAVGPDLHSPSGDFDTGYSLIGNGSSASIIDGGGNQIGTAGTPIDPLLGPLAANGGPTLTHALLAGSPAINTGDPSVLAFHEFDQRLAPFHRVENGRIDVGAYEVQIAPAQRRLQPRRPGRRGRLYRVAQDARLRCRLPVQRRGRQRQHHHRPSRPRRVARQFRRQRPAAADHSAHRLPGQFGRRIGDRDCRRGGRQHDHGQLRDEPARHPDRLPERAGGAARAHLHDGRAQRLVALYRSTVSRGLSPRPAGQ